MNKTSIGHGAVYITVSTIIFVIAGYVTNIWLGRYLGPSSYGVYGIILSLITIINLTQTAGLPLALSKYIAEDERKSESILKSGLILQLISTSLAAILFFILAQPTARMLNDISLVPYIQLSSLVFPIYGLYYVYFNYYNGLHQFKTQAFMNSAYSVIRLIAIIALVYYFNIYGAILGFIITPLIVLIFWIHIPKGVKKRFSFKTLIIFSLPMIGVAIFSTLLQSVDILFVKSILQSDIYTGYYTANQNIAKIPFYIISALAAVLYPSISKSISSKQSEETKKLINKSIRFTLLILLPTISFIAITSSNIIELFYSAEYLPGSSSLSILIIGAGFFTLYTLLATIISSSGSPYKSFILTGVGLAFTCLLCILLIPQFGINGASWATTLGCLIAMIAASVIVYKNFNTLVQIKSVAKIVSATLIAASVISTMQFPNYLLPVVYCLGFCVYLILIYIFKEVKPEDISLIKSFTPSRLKKG